MTTLTLTRAAWAVGATALSTHCAHLGPHVACTPVHDRSSAEEARGGLLLRSHHNGRGWAARGQTGFLQAPEAGGPRCIFRGAPALPVQPHLWALRSRGRQGGTARV